MILVTGATGVVGHFVVEELLRRGHPVRALCRSEEAAQRVDPRADRAIGDLRDLATLRDAVRDATAIVHAACTFTERECDVDAMAALLAGWPRGPFVFISSLDVYGFAGAGVITEDTPVTESHTDYARGKVICERLLADAGRSDWVALRAPYIWGPHPTARRRLVPQRMLDGAPIVLPGAELAEWNQYCDAWVDTRDLAVIVAKALADPPGEPLNVATGHFVWHELYAALIRLTRSPSEIVHRQLDAISDEELPRKQLYAQRWQFSEQRLASRLGEVPRRPLDVTLRDTVGAAAGF